MQIILEFVMRLRFLFCVWNREGVAPNLTTRWQKNTVYWITDVIDRLITAHDDINNTDKNDIIT